MTQTERAIDKSRASLNGLCLYDFEDRGGLLHQFLSDTNATCINNNWRGATPYQIPPEYYWHEMAVSLIERAFREKWKFSTLSTIIKTQFTPQALPTAHPKRHTTALIYAAITIECTNLAVLHICPLRKAYELQKIASASFDELVAISKMTCDALYSPTFLTRNTCFRNHLIDCFYNILGDHINQ